MTKVSWKQHDSAGPPPRLLPTQPKNQYSYDTVSAAQTPVTKESFFPSLLSSPLAGDHWDAADPAPGGSAGAGYAAQQHRDSLVTLQEEGRVLLQDKMRAAEAGPCSSLAAPQPLPSTARPSHSPWQDQSTPTLLPELGGGEGRAPVLE